MEFISGEITMAHQHLNRKPDKVVVELSDKRAYRTPLLAVFGAVRQFTQGSVGMTGDATNTLQPMSSLAYKTNIQRVGTHPQGFGLYLFDYKPEFLQMGAFGRQFGVIAEEVQAVMPEAVEVGADGYTRVNYTMLGIELPKRNVH